jgi:hypothetical protein
MERATKLMLYRTNPQQYMVEYLKMPAPPPAPPLPPVDDWTPVGPSAATPQKISIWPPLFDFAKLAFIPPLLLLALGYIGLWVGRGFRR